MHSMSLLYLCIMMAAPCKAFKLHVSPLQTANMQEALHNTIIAETVTTALNTAHPFHTKKLLLTCSEYTLAELMIPNLSACTD